MEPTTYVLIPGAWHGGWVWRPVAERLRASGHRAVPLTLPGLGDGDDPSGRRLQEAIDYVVAAVEQSDADRVTLVGHSWAEFFKVVESSGCYAAVVSVSAVVSSAGRLIQAVWGSSRIFGA